MRAVGETIIETVIHSDGHAASVPPVSIASVPPVSITSVPPDQRVSVEVKQDHLFRYPSEWDPRETGKTKGGYLEGKIQLPKVNLLKNISKMKNFWYQVSFPLRMTISTFPVLAPPNPLLKDIHPTIIHVVGIIVVNIIIAVRCAKGKETDETRTKSRSRTAVTGSKNSWSVEIIFLISQGQYQINIIVIITKT